MDVDMAINDAAEYLGKLLNRPVAADTPLRLTSAQRARFNAWLQSSGLVVSNPELTGQFTLAALLTGAPGVARPAAETTGTRSESASALSLGIDMQSISELTATIRNGDLKADPELVRLFTLQELSYAQARPKPHETLAGLFAAKEAMRKCRSEPQLSAEEFRALEVLPDLSGRPTAAGYQISISHSGDYAVAVALRAKLPAITPPTAPTTVAPKPRRAARWLLPALLVSTLVMISLLLLLLTRVKG
jgi:phosphopantetheine--protein transferase-like protein